MATWYPYIKTFHLVFVIAFMACVFYLPRILVNIAEAGGQSEVQARLVLMGRRLKRFGHIMFFLTLVFGVWLWFGFHLQGGWLHAKLFLVALLFVYFLMTGRMLERAAAGGALPGARALRWLNELPVFLLFVVVWLAIAKPF